jgi:hypothetical protein
MTEDPDYREFDPEGEGDPEPLVPWATYNDDDDDPRVKRLRELVAALMADPEDKEGAARLVATVIYLETTRHRAPDDRKGRSEMVAAAREEMYRYGLRPN